MDNQRRLVLTVDEGTTSVRSILWDGDGNLLSSSQAEITQIYPHPGWVEHDPEQIWRLSLDTIRQCVDAVGIKTNELSCIGITNQRETSILWDAHTGRPIHNAIVWQDRRTAEIADKLREEPGDFFKRRTGLMPDSYFSAVKVKWLVDNLPEVRSRCERGEICFGTVDSYLMWKLSDGRIHATDYSNASRTMLFNLRKLDWDGEIADVLDIPPGLLMPEVKPSSFVYGYTDPDVLGASVPLSGDAGDQQAALFGEACFTSGMAKVTYGTGSFVLVNTGEQPCDSKRLITTVAWGLNPGKATYALEGSIFATGAAIQWLRDGLGIISESAETESLARSVKDNAGVYFVPAFVGLGAPHWDQYARGLLVGITRGTDVAHLCRAVLESIAYQVSDVLDVMRLDSASGIEQLRVDGGAARNNFLLQFQSDISGLEVIRPHLIETTALGVAYLAGLGVGIWTDLSEITSMWQSEQVFRPSMSEGERQRLLRCWREALSRSLGWARVSA